MYYDIVIKVRKLEGGVLVKLSKSFVFFLSQEIELDRKSRSECNDLLFVLGFMRKSREDEEVDEERRKTLKYKTTKQLEEEADDDEEAYEKKEEL